MPPETSSLLAVHRTGRLARAHVERFATELATRHARVGPIGYSGHVGCILRSTFLHEGQLILQPCERGCASDGSASTAWTDVATVMCELELLAPRSLAGFFLAAWLEQSGDFDALASLRSLVAAPVGPASMIITHGLSGAGKTTVATALAGLIGAVVVRVDAEVVRSRDLALSASAVIDRIETLAARSIAAGWPVIVEACFLSRADRQRFQAKAFELGVPFVILECSAPLSVIRERLNRRRAFGSLFHGQDASADLVEEKLQAQLDRLDPLDADERALTLSVDTGERVDHARLAERIRAQLERGGRAWCHGVLLLDDPSAPTEAP